jgi:hypothetical protein
VCAAGQEQIVSATQNTSRTIDVQNSQAEKEHDSQKRLDKRAAVLNFVRPFCSGLEMLELIVPVVIL